MSPLLKPHGLPDALVLDLDGTLIDSAADLADAVNRLLQELERPALSADDVRGMVGDGIGMLTVRALEATGGMPEAADGQMLAQRLLLHYVDPKREQRTEIFEGVVETLEQLTAAGVSLGLCTNKPQKASQMLLEEVGLRRFFDSVVGHDRAPAPKPNAAHVREVLAELGHPASAVMVGDSVNDLESGRNAGLPVVLVTYGYGTPAALAAADRTIDRFAELPAALAALGAAAD